MWRKASVLVPTGVNTGQVLLHLARLLILPPGSIDERAEAVNNIAVCRSRDAMLESSPRKEDHVLCALIQGCSLFWSLIDGHRRDLVRLLPFGATHLAARRVASHHERPQLDPVLHARAVGKGRGSIMLAVARSHKLALAAAYPAFRHAQSELRNPLSWAVL